jgi:integrase
MRLFYLHQRKPSNVWHVTFTVPETGKLAARLSTKTTIRREAEVIAQQWLRDGLPESSKNPLPVSQTFCDYLKEFWDFDHSQYFKEQITMGKKPTRRHVKDMKDLVDRYFVAFFGSKKLNQIDESILQDFLVHLCTDKGLAASSVNRARNTAFVALRYAKRRKLIKDFNFEAVLRASGNAKARGILEREEAERLFQLEWRDPRSKLMTLIAFQTGMRMGEIQALRICDIHEDRISVAHSWSKIDGGLKSTKNQECRIVPILPELYTEIQNYRKIYRPLFNMDSLLFPSLLETTPYDGKQVKEDFYKMLEKIGISEAERKERNIVFHSWRHYCAKNLAQVTNRAIGMAILGHKTSAMFDHYANHVDKETFNKMREAITEGLKPGIGMEKEIVFPKRIEA